MQRPRRGQRIGAVGEAGVGEAIGARLGHRCRRQQSSGPGTARLAQEFRFGSRISHIWRTVAAASVRRRVQCSHSSSDLVRRYAALDAPMTRNQRLLECAASP